MAQHTTVFQSGNSQAVRLPKEFRFKSKTVEIYRRGDEVVLREKPRTVGEILDSLPPITDDEAEQIRKTFEDVRDRRPAEERDWSWLEPADPPKAPKSRTTPRSTARATRAR